MNQNNLENLVREFLEYCEVERGHSQKTITNYEHYLGRFLEWAEKSNIKTPEQITLEKIKKYRLYLNRIKNNELRIMNGEKKEKTLSRKTQNYHIIALRAFLKYLVKNDVKTLVPEKIELADTDERQINFLETNEVEKLLQSPQTKNIIGLRDRAILEVLFSTGLRVSELVSLNRDKININKGEFSVCGKGGKIRLVFLSDRAKIALGEYLKMRNDDDGAVFVNHNKAKSVKLKEQSNSEKFKNKILNTKYQIRNTTRLTPRSIQRIINKYATKAGITKKVTPHILRHSFGTDLLRSGADIRAVQQLLGHSSITTTQIYTHVTDQHLRDVHRTFHGIKHNKK